MTDESLNTRRVGVYDRPASADRSKAARLIAIAVVVIVVAVAVMWFMRG